MDPRLPQCQRVQQALAPVPLRSCNELAFRRPSGVHQDYPFDIRPTTDDRPYHSLTQRWRGIRHLREKLGSQWVRYADWGYIVLWATLAQAVLLSALLILLPLTLGIRRPSGSCHASRVTRHGSLATFVYFSSLGIAYMFIEIVLMQKLSLFLASPIYAAAIVLTTFMVGVGTRQPVGGRMRGGPEVAVTRGVLGILGVGFLLWFGMDWFLGRLAGQAFAVRALVAAACVGGLAFFMACRSPQG